MGARRFKFLLKWIARKEIHIYHVLFCLLYKHFRPLLTRKVGRMARKAGDVSTAHWQYRTRKKNIVILNVR